MCGGIQQGYLTPTYRTEYFGAYMFPEWETCQSTGARCLLDSAMPNDTAAYAAPQNCQQGSVPDYYIDVHTADDVIRALAFSRTTHVPLVIKNSGHDYKGRSSQKGSLALWTHHLASMSYNPSFIPKGCNTSYPGMTLGAGAQWEDVYRFADSVNVTMVGGYHQTVGASGGWLLGGGHSVLSPVYGLGVDRVLEFKVVTPDGTFRIANACQNKDLFWALRGGGPGFGVVLEQTSLAEPRRIPLQVAFIKFSATAAIGQQFVKIIIDNALKWASEGWGGHSSPFQLINVTPLLTLDQAKASVKPVTDFASALPGAQIVVEELDSWWAFFEKYVTTYESPIGSPTVLSSRLMPSALFAANLSRDTMYQAYVNASAYVSPGILMVTPYLWKYEEGSTSVTNAWRTSLWHMGLRGVWAYNSTKAQILNDGYGTSSNAAQFLRAISPGSGAYQNEADLHEPNHQESFWGKENYARLSEIKNTYDPDHLFDCWQCVGWKGKNDSLYSCYV